jgi:hypothetical protein
MPVVPCLMVMAAFGVDTLLRRGSRGEAVRMAGLHD